MKFKITENDDKKIIPRATFDGNYKKQTNYEEK